MHQIAARVLTEPCVPAPPALFAYCPTMDLVATVGQSGGRRKGVVDVWRLNGQRVFGAVFGGDDADGDEDANKDGGDGDSEGEDGSPEGQAASGLVRGLCWRRDGQILAVACSDGSVSLINAFTGKIAHRLSTTIPTSIISPATSFGGAHQSHAQKKSRKSTRSDSMSGSALRAKPRTFVSSISWTTHFATLSPSLVRQGIEAQSAIDKEVMLDHLLGLKADVNALLSLKADLPRELSAIDVETSLPKLATLPPIGVGSGDDVFSSRGSVDAVFHASSTGVAGAVDALVLGLREQATGQEGGRCVAHLRTFDSFEIGAVDVGACLPSHGSGASVRRTVTHPYLSTILLLVEEADRSLHLVGLDLSFIPQTGRNLPLVARKVTQLGNLLRYVSQVQMQLSAEVKAAFDLPARFLRNINESLAEADPDADFAFAAHHLAVTGECEPRVKEWLVDEVADRGLKRWEKAVGDCLDVVRRMTSECLLPALERMQVVLSRLDGLARFSGTRERLGLEEKDVRRVIETVDVLSLLAEDMLMDVNHEIKEFGAFMKWMKWECEVEALEDGSERAEELRETWTGEHELRTVLDYVGGAMSETRLKRYINVAGPGGSDNTTTGTSFEEETDAGFYADYTQRRASDKKQKMPTLAVLLERLKNQCDLVFGQIAETFRKSILSSYMMPLTEQGDGSVMDLRIISDLDDAAAYRLITIAKDSSPSEAIHLTTIEIRQDGTKMLRSKPGSSTTLQIPGVREVLDAKIPDDGFLLVLAAAESEIRIYRRRISSQAATDAWELRHVFEDGKMAAGMNPARLEVNGNAGRRVAGVVDQAGLGFVVLDLDAGHDEAAEQRTEDELMTG